MRQVHTPLPPLGKCKSPVVHGWPGTEEVAALLKVDPSTIRRWRTARPPPGPPFVRLTSRLTLYSVHDLEHWVTQHRIDPK
ncbi:hypothetical protein EDD27_2118 [Nonomuraea polychroma]|uniref:Helix-turn-helix domain-containing protein n=1 Tax=Nonomuraea polychroma TaxID=46176 RepID=A0A438M2N7_9ACTN|nr:hypothetical protein EDD27_2118 [Nonomuraea polychroma]